MPKNYYIWDRIKSIFYVTVSAYMLSAALEMTTGQLILPRVWWLGIEADPYCIFCSKDIDEAVRNGSVSYADLSFVARFQTRVKTIIATEDAAALWDTVLGAVLSLLALIWFSFMVGLLFMHPEPWDREK